MLTGNEIRQQFIDFFVKKHGHTFVPSSPVVPHDDPTLLFTNAGMNQFKDVFLGTGTRPYKRAANTQKCIRAGGKHNDLDDVGRDTYHHTFFEMLGNWSFGDYFKKEAIQWAWELLTEVWKLDKTRLHATVFEGSPNEGVPRDDEAHELWKSVTDIDHSHIHWGNKKDNFWMMGETGPCGPCTEVHFDRTADKVGGHLVNKGSPEVIEIWNLVFIQFNSSIPKEGLEELKKWDSWSGAKRQELVFSSRDAILQRYKTLLTLPAKHVDTGMGFERVTAVIQDKASNYDTDVFSPIMDAIGRMVGRRYGHSLNDINDVAFRVIADHLRMATFAITDGARPGNKKRDAVLRSVIRRAVRFGYKCFGLRDPFLHKIVPTVVEQMGGAFPALRDHSTRVEEIIRVEEQDFLKTIEKGLVEFQYAVFRTVFHLIAKKKNYEPFRLIESAFGQPGNREEGMKASSSDIFHATLWFKHEGKDIYERLDDIPGDENSIEAVLRRYGVNEPIMAGNEVFNLYATAGFPPDLTQQMAQERGFTVNMEEYKFLMKEHEGKSRGAGKEHSITALQGKLPSTDDSLKYMGLHAQAKVVGSVKDNQVANSGNFKSGDEAALLLDRTNFYAEQGGQVGDTGTITSATGTFEVENTQKLGDSVLHVGRVVDGHIEVGQNVELQVGGERADTMRNHTATHLLNWALRRVLGEHIEQKGSLVDPEKTRFDFAHDAPLTLEQVAEVEQLVNEKVYNDLPVNPVIMPLAEAKKIPGVRAVFGEKYPDPVRVLLVGASKPEEATEETSVEFCGGTHLHHTGEAGFFKIISQEAVGKGVRRVIAVTGRAAVQEVQQMSALLADLSGRFSCRPSELSGRIDALEREVKSLQQQLKKGAATDLQGAGDKLLADAVEKNGSKIIIGELPAGPIDQLRNQIDRLRQKAGSAVIVVGWKEDGDKVGLIVSATDDLVKKGIHAGKLVGQIAKLVGGGGGGKPNMAQAGGKDPAKLGAALELAKTLVNEQLV